MDIYVCSGGASKYSRGAAKSIPPPRIAPIRCFGAEARDSARQQQRQADCHGRDGDGSDERRRSYLSACLIDEVMKGSQKKISVLEVPC